MQANPSQTSPKWPVLILQVANEAGKQQYLSGCDKEQPGTYKLEIIQALNTILPHGTELNPNDINQGARRAAAHLGPSGPQHTEQPASAKVRNLPRDSDIIQHATPVGQHPPTPSTHPVPYGPKPLRFDWRLMAYTDGSYIDKAKAVKQGLPDDAPCIGASVYIPSEIDRVPDKLLGYLPSEEDYQHDDNQQSRAGWPADGPQKWMYKHC